MVRFGDHMPSRRDTRVAPSDAGVDEFLIECVMSRWDDGLDTYAIAVELFEHEAAVAAALRAGRERRRKVKHT